MLNHPRVVEVLTTQSILAEVQEYAARLARKKRLSISMVLLAIATLPVTVIEPQAYAEELPEPERRIGHRDPSDVDLLALALHERVPVWSTDNDFQDAGVEWYTTAELLRRLEPPPPKP